MSSSSLFRRLLQPTTVALAWLAIGAVTTQAQLAFNFESDELPLDTEAFGVARLADDPSGVNRSLRLTDPVGDTQGYFLVKDIGSGKPVKAIHVKWKSLIGGGTAADGYSVNFAADLPETPDLTHPSEEGIGTGLTVTVDTFDNGFGEAPGIEIRWKSNLVASASIPNEDPGGGLPYLRKNEFVDAEFMVSTKGLATFTYDGVTINAQLSGWKGITGGEILFGARTGGANDRHWIDDLSITTGIFTSGTYVGTVFPNSGTAMDQMGSISLKVTPQGSYSGVLLLGSTRLPITGRFDRETLVSEISIIRPGTTALNLGLKLASKNSIHGELSDGTWSSSVSAYRNVWDKTRNPATNHAGTYTFWAKSGFAPGEPNGATYGTMVVDTAGGVRFAGVLGDGSKVAYKSAIDFRGAFPLHLITHSGEGLMIGLINVRNDGSVVSGVRWERSGNVPGPLHPRGFTLTPAVHVSPYLPPAPNERILPFASGIAAFGSSEIDFLTPFALTSLNQVIDLGTQRLSVRFNTKTGLFTGTVDVPGTTIKLKFGGVADQAWGFGIGHFLGATQSGNVILEVNR